MLNIWPKPQTDLISIIFHLPPPPAWALFFFYCSQSLWFFFFCFITVQFYSPPPQDTTSTMPTGYIMKVNKPSTFKNFAIATGITTVAFAMLFVMYSVRGARCVYICHVERRGGGVRLTRTLWYIVATWRGLGGRNFRLTILSMTQMVPNLQNYYYNHKKQFPAIFWSRIRLLILWFTFRWKWNDLLVKTWETYTYNTMLNRTFLWPLSEEKVSNEAKTYLIKLCRCQRWWRGLCPSSWYAGDIRTDTID